LEDNIEKEFIERSAWEWTRFKTLRIGSSDGLV
jgi:hypothetical protein